MYLLLCGLVPAANAGASAFDHVLAKPLRTAVMTEDLYRELRRGVLPRATLARVATLSCRALRELHETSGYRFVLSELRAILRRHGLDVGLTADEIDVFRTSGRLPPAGPDSLPCRGAIGPGVPEIRAPSPRGDLAAVGTRTANYLKTCGLFSRAAVARAWASRDILLCFGIGAQVRGEIARAFALPPLGLELTPKIKRELARLKVRAWAELRPGHPSAKASRVRPVLRAELASIISRLPCAPELGADRTTHATPNARRP